MDNLRTGWATAGGCELEEFCCSACTTLSNLKDLGVGGLISRWLGWLMSSFLNCGWKKINHSYWKWIICFFLNIIISRMKAEKIELVVGCCQKENSGGRNFRERIVWSLNRRFARILWGARILWEEWMFTAAMIRSEIHKNIDPGTWCWMKTLVIPGDETNQWFLTWNSTRILVELLKLPGQENMFQDTIISTL